MKNKKNQPSRKSKRSDHRKSEPRSGYQGKQNSGAGGSVQKRERYKDHKPKDNKKEQKRGAKALPVALFGYHAVSEALLNEGRDIQTLYVSEAGLKTLDDVMTNLPERHRRLQPQIVDKAQLDNSLPPGSVHQGVALACEDLPEYSAQDLIIAADAANRSRSVIVMLDQVTDPHNVGAILRSSCVFGAAGLVMQRRHAPALNGVLAKTACGAVEHIKTAYETNLSRALEEFQNAGYVAMGLDERGVSDIGNWAQSFKSPPDKIVLVLGAEGPGLRPLVRDHCDVLVKLPTSGAISSLNVSNAAAVSLFAVLQTG